MRIANFSGRDLSVAVIPSGFYDKRKVVPVKNGETVVYPQGGEWCYVAVEVSGRAIPCSGKVTHDMTFTFRLAQTDSAGEADEPGEGQHG
jgi:hypothetical protein